MKEVWVQFKEQHRETFVLAEQGRAGGSYTVTVRYEPGWVVVVNEWGDETAFPSADVRLVIAKEVRRW